MRRDRMTFAMMLGVPIMQLMLFGFAINTDPKHLPTARADARRRPLTRAVRRGAGEHRLFRLRAPGAPSGRGRRAARTGDGAIRRQIPASFDARRAARRAAGVLVEADATDPAATGGASRRAGRDRDQALARELQRAVATDCAAKRSPSSCVVHRRYNPEGITQYNIVPGLLGVILTMTMMMITALAMTREIERGTMENLLPMPIKPVEIMIGKIAPFVLVGFVQVTRSSWSPRISLFGVPIARQPRRCSSRCRRCSSPPTSPSATPSPPSPRTSCRRCR